MGNFFFTVLTSKFIKLSVFKMMVVAYVKTFWHRFQQQLLDFLFLPCTNPKQIICKCCGPKSYCISQNMMFHDWFYFLRAYYIQNIVALCIFDNFINIFPLKS